MRYKLKGTSKVDDVIELANLIKMPLLPWQEFVLRDMLRVDKKGMWIRKTNLLLVARQNGKTTIVLSWELDRALNWHVRQRIVYTAQTGNDARKKLLKRQGA